MRHPFILRKQPNGKTYRSVLVPDHPDASKQGYILEHRLVMEQIIGRRLKRGEVVHHVNEDGLDNRPGNLRLYASAGQHAAHAHGGVIFKGRQ